MIQEAKAGTSQRSATADARCGFSVVEMLVVIAVVGLAALFLVPALRSAGRRAAVAACMSNLRQTGSAILAYAADRGELPDNEPPTVDGQYYRYRTRGANGIFWTQRLAGPNGPQQARFRCAASLPGSGWRRGAIPFNARNWVWAGRSQAGHAQEYDPNLVRNRDRGWFMYQGPLRAYVGADGQVACTEENLLASAWDTSTDGWHHNNSLSPLPPIERSAPPNTPTSLKTPGRRVIAYCPNVVRVPGPRGDNPWWHEWRAPHLDRPWPGDAVTTTPSVDARNYLFTDGSAIFLHYDYSQTGATTP